MWGGHITKKERKKKKRHLYAQTITTTTEDDVLYVVPVLCMCARQKKQRTGEQLRADRFSQGPDFPTAQGSVAGV